MAQVPRCLKLYGKAEAALISAIEIYNKPDFRYREEAFAILALKFAPPPRFPDLNPSAPLRQHYDEWFREARLRVLQEIRRAREERDAGWTPRRR